MELNIKGLVIQKAGLRIEETDNNEILLKFDTNDNKHQVQFILSKIEEKILLNYLLSRRK